MSFKHAIVRPPGRNYERGLTCANAGPPQLATALLQHAAYCDALRACGLELTGIDADADHPDGTFVEDTAVVTPRGAILTRPGALSRRGEIDRIGSTLQRYFSSPLSIDAPGTVDGGDVCEADGHFLIGVSARTNEEGARQLAAHLRHMGHTATRVDIRASRTLLHLKTGVAYLGDGVWVLAAGIERDLPFGDLGIRAPVVVDPDEAYAANCVRVNEAVLVAAGYPRLAEALAARGLELLPLEMSEFRKMDGGLSCLSLRF